VVHQELHHVRLVEHADKSGITSAWTLKSF
jgi:hypothetical protein